VTVTELLQMQSYYQSRLNDTFQKILEENKYSGALKNAMSGSLESQLSDDISPL